MSIPELEEILQKWRANHGIADAKDRPFQWSIQDFWVLARLRGADFVFAHERKDGRIVIDRWISATTKPVPIKRYTILWGPRHLTVFKGKISQFSARDLPPEFLTALDTVSPLAEDAVPESTATIPAIPAVAEDAAVASAVAEDAAVDATAGAGAVAEDAAEESL
jgi:hypothetical protein